MAVYFTDTFTGSAGNIQGHVPDTGAWTHSVDPYQWWMIAAAPGGFELMGDGTVLPNAGATSGQEAYVVFDVTDDISTAGIYIEVDMTLGGFPVPSGTTVTFTFALTVYSNDAFDNANTISVATTLIGPTAVGDTPTGMFMVHATPGYGNAPSEYQITGAYTKLRLELDFANEALRFLVNDVALNTFEAHFTPYAGYTYPVGQFQLTLDADDRVHANRFRITRAESGLLAPSEPPEDHTAPVIIDELVGTGTMQSRVPDLVPAGGYWGNTGNTQNLQLMGDGTCTATSAGGGRINMKLEGTAPDCLVTGAYVKVGFIYGVGTVAPDHGPSIVVTLSAGSGPGGGNDQDTLYVSIDNNSSPAPQQMFLMFGSTFDTVYPGLPVDTAQHVLMLTATWDFDADTVDYKAYVDDVLYLARTKDGINAVGGPATYWYPEIRINDERTLNDRMRLTRVEYGQTDSTPPEPGPVAAKFWTGFVNTREYS